MSNLTKSLVLAQTANQDEMLHPANPFTAPVAGDGISSLSRYAEILKQTWKRIALFSLLCTAITVFVCAHLSPIYEASSTVNIDVSAAPGFIGQEAQRPISVTDGDQIISTQVNLIQSDSVLRSVNDKLHFTPEELGFEDSSMKNSYLKNGYDVRNAPLQLKRLAVKRIPSTSLIKISYRASDRKRAAEVANAVAASYLAHAFNQRLQSSEALSSFMDKQLTEMKQKMEGSSAALARYEKDLDIVNPEQKTNIISARLLQLNESYTNAQAERMSKQAAYEAAKAGTLEAAETNPHSDELRRLVEKRNALQADFTVTAQTYGRRSQNYKSAKAEIDQMDAQIQAAQNNIVQRSDIEYRQALANEQTLLTAVTQSKKEFDRINSQSFGYEQLRRDAENDRRLYEDVQRRIREAGLNSAFQNNSIRLADLARPPVLPAFPRVGLLGAVALVLSAILAYLGAIVFHLLTRKVHSVDEIVRKLGVPVIGTLPRVKRVRSLRGEPQLLGNGVVNVAAPLGPLFAGQPSSTGSSFKESIRSVRNAVLAWNTANAPISILITSALASEGKSTAALALALSHASRHNRTLLIDADIRRPSLSSNNGNEPGLAEILVDGAPWQELLRSIPHSAPLDFIAAGNDARRACDHLHQLEYLIAEAKSHYDLIIVDSSPVLCFADSAQMASMIDGVVLVSSAPETNLSTLELALDNLYIAGAKLVGIVMNQVEDLHLRVGYTKYTRKYATAASA